MEDIINSMKRALSRDGWLWTQITFRLGNPFGWADYESNPEHTFLSGSSAFLRYIFMFYGDFPTPPEIQSKNYEEVRQNIVRTMQKACEHFVPASILETFTVEDAIRNHALIRAQDFGFLQTFCKDLEQGCRHLDIGPGLGSHGLYSLPTFKSKYYAVEAIPNTYAVQRLSLRYFCPSGKRYLDAIDLENFGMEKQKILQEINESPEYGIVHLPSWNFAWLEDKSIDLATSTWTLNEVTGSALLWLLANASRVLKKGGYFYIRDAQTLHHHQIRYDELLGKMGFELTKRMEMQNRVNYFGIPRLYQKRTNRAYTFNELVDLALGDFAKKAIGGLYLPLTRELKKQPV